MQELSENTIKKLIAGDEPTFNLVYSQYSGKIYKLAFRFLKDAEQSEEIVQEAFINLWLSKEKLDPSGNIWLYLYVIARRLALNALKKIYKSADLLEKLIYNIQEAHSNTEEEILAHDLEQFTKMVISKLPKQQQLIFTLSRIEGLSHKEIATQLKISPNTVKNHMVEALKTVKRHLSYSDLTYLIILSYWI